MDDEKSGRPATSTELSVAFAGPAPVVNRTFVTGGPTGVRPSFAEPEPGGERCHFRAAVTMHPAEALHQAQILMQLFVPQPTVEARAPKSPLN